jgi:hypothetical protein
MNCKDFPSNITVPATSGGWGFVTELDVRVPGPGDSNGRGGSDG